MTSVLYVLAILALIYIAGLSLGVVIIFTYQIGMDHGRRPKDEGKTDKPYYFRIDRIKQITVHRKKCDVS